MTVTACPACAGETGTVHTCTGSGLQVAQVAHAAGAVDPVREVPALSVWLEFRIRSSEAEARELVDAIATTLVGHPLVSGPVTWSVSEGHSPR